MRAGETALTILIVEDQALISLNIEDVVRSMGSRVIGCGATRSIAGGRRSISSNIAKI